MQIIIGRDAKTSQLSITIGQKAIRIGAPGSVPKSVSRQHCRLTETGEGLFSVENIKPENVTFINNIPIEKKTIQPNDALSLGNDRYQVDMKAVRAEIDKLKPKTADIRPLRNVWENYQQFLIKEEIRNRQFNAIASCTGIFTLGAVITTFIPDADMRLRYALYAIAATLTIVTAYKRWRDSNRGPLIKKEREEKFHKRYSCPNCHHQFSMRYDELLNYDNCPHCKAKFVK